MPGPKLCRACHGDIGSRYRNAIYCEACRDRIRKAKKAATWQRGKHKWRGPGSRRKPSPLDTCPPTVAMSTLDQCFPHLRGVTITMNELED